jgi:hypothetical protein
MIKERGSLVEREVDVLIQLRACGTDLHIAVECRGGKHKDDILWIDQLIGKYRDLDVHKVIAVSRSGFSAPAIEKANANRIETLTLEQALDTDWPSQFERLAIGRLVRSDTPHCVDLHVTPPLPFPLTVDTPVVSANGQQFSTVDMIARDIYQRRKSELDRVMMENFRSLFETVGDLENRSILWGITEEPAVPLFIDGQDEQRHQINAFTLRIQSLFTIGPSKLEHYRLGSAQVTMATIEAGENTFSVMAVQLTDKPNMAKVHVEEAISAELPKPRSVRPRKRG